jgi:predicted component of type VI protein secretion system
MAPPAQLHCVDTSVLKDGIGAQIMLDDREVSIGRDAKNQASLHAQGVSRYHARVFAKNGDWLVEDVGSTNGTRVNNSKLEETQTLKHGDTIAFGRACYKFQLLSEPHEVVTVVTVERDIDLGAADKATMTGSGQPSPATSNPGAPAPAARTTTTANPAAAKSGGGNIVLWIIVIAAFAAMLAGGAKLLGVI